jgi:hypothetical protein
LATRRQCLRLPVQSSGEPRTQSLIDVQTLRAPLKTLEAVM